MNSQIKELNRLTNASVESFTTKLKEFRATFREVNDVRFSLFRVAKLYPQIINPQTYKLSLQNPVRLRLYELSHNKIHTAITKKSPQ